MCMSVISMAEVTAVFIEEIGMSYAEDNYITGGNAGWVFAGSQILENGSQINITLTYLVNSKKVQSFDICAGDSVQKTSFGALLEYVFASLISL